MKSDVHVLGIIPARGGSKRIPKKNIIDVAGKPLIEYTINAAQQSALLDACIVSTDNQEIADVASSLGADVPFLRPKEIATDTSTDIEYVQHTLSWVKEHRDWHPDIIVLLPPDIPHRTSADIDGVITFLQESDFDSVRTIAGPIEHPPLKAMWKMKDGNSKDILPLFPQFVGKPSQYVPAYYYAFALVYALRARCIEEGSLWGKNIGGYIVNKERYLDIDNKEQLNKAATFLQ